MRRHWREVGFWRWWWEWRVASETKVVLAFAGCCVLVAGGFVASRLITASTAPASAAKERVGIRTVKRVLTVRENARVRRVVPVVQTVLSRRPGVTRTQTQTRVQTRTVALPETGHVITTAVLRPVRVLERRTVTVTDKPQAHTVMQTVTTKQAPQTVVQTVTYVQPPSVQPAATSVRTVTEREPERTVTLTTTQPVTVLRTTTDLATATQTETLTTTAPVVTSTTTVTVTTTVPRGH